MELENDRMKSVTKGLTRYFAKRGSGAKPPDFIKLKKIALQGKQKTEKKRSAGAQDGYIWYSAEPVLASKRLLALDKKPAIDHVGLPD
jgi:hypothetical protein